MVQGMGSRVVARGRGVRIRAYVLEPGVVGVLEAAAVFPAREGDEVVAAAVRGDLGRAVYTTLNAAVCVGRGGEVVWSEDFVPRSMERYGHHPGVAYSLDGRTVWVYRPDAMAGRGRGDQWVVHDAGNGAVLARHELSTVGHGGSHVLHPSDGSVYLDIGEGQDGSVVVRGTLGADREARFSTYPWGDRCLVAVAADGQHFMTVDHGQGDVSFHRHPSGDVLRTVPVAVLGYDPEDAFVEWSSGYLTSDLAVVTVSGEDEATEQEWFRHHLLDVATGTPVGDLTTTAADPYDLEPLGDGTWLTDDEHGNPVRWAHTPASAEG